MDLLDMDDCFNVQTKNSENPNPQPQDKPCLPQNPQYNDQQPVSLQWLKAQGQSQENFELPQSSAIQDQSDLFATLELYENNKTQFEEKYKVGQKTEELGSTNFETGDQPALIVETVHQPAEIIDTNERSECQPSFVLEEPSL
jgi:hypothetical protein